MSYNNISIMAKSNQTISFKIYCNALEFIQKVGHTFIFQRENATCHTSDITKNWSDTNYFDTLPWLAKSSDSNLVQNIWCILAPSVYKNQHQFTTFDDLETCMLQIWNNNSLSTVRELYLSLRTECVSDRENGRGKVIHLSFLIRPDCWFSFVLYNKKS